MPVVILCQPHAGPMGALAHGCSLGGEPGHWVEGPNLLYWVLGECSAWVTDRPGAGDTTTPGWERGRGARHDIPWAPRTRAALEGKGPQRRPQRRLGRRLEEVVKAVGGGYCRLQMPLKRALAVRETVAGHRQGALEGGGYLPPF